MFVSVITHERTSGAKIEASETRNSYFFPPNVKSVRYTLEVSPVNLFTASEVEGGGGGGGLRGVESSQQGFAPFHSLGENSLRAILAD